MLTKPFKIKGPENVVSKMTAGTSLDQLDAYRGTSWGYSVRSLKPSPERILMRVRCGEKINEKLNFDGTSEEKAFTLDLFGDTGPPAGMGLVTKSSKGLHIFVGRLGKNLGNEDIVLVDGKEIVTAIVNAVEEYREQLERNIERAGNLLLGPEIDDWALKRHYYDRNQEAYDHLLEVTKMATRLQRIKMLAMGIHECHKHHDTEEVSDIVPPKLALVFPEKYRSVSSASGVISLLDVEGIGGDPPQTLITMHSFQLPMDANMWPAPFEKPEFVALGDEVLISFEKAETR